MATSQLLIGGASTIWTQLSLPNPPAGGIPFVYTDNASIAIDIANLFYDQVLLQLFTNALAMPYTASAVNGAVTINSSMGTVNFGAGTKTLVLTNSVITATSIVLAMLTTVDATALYVSNCITIVGQTTINLNANATGVVAVDFVVLGTSK
jgi:hypothetical protein